MARGWSVPQSRPRVAVPTGLFPSYRRTCGSRLESVFCCFDVRSPAYSFFPNVTPHRFLSPLRVKNTVEALVRHSDHCPPKSGNFRTPIVTVTAINRNVA